MKNHPFTFGAVAAAIVLTTNFSLALDEASKKQANLECREILNTVKRGAENPLTLTDDEGKQLWRLAAAPAIVKETFIDVLLSERNCEAALFQRGDELTHAIVGLDPTKKWRRLILSKLYDAAKSSPGSFNRQYFFWAERICDSSPEAFTYERMTLAIAAVYQIILAKNSHQSEEWGDMVARLAEKLPPKNALMVARTCVFGIGETNKLTMLGEFEGRLLPIVKSLSPRESTLIARDIAAAMNKTKDAYRLSAFGNGLGALQHGFTAEDANIAAQRIVAQMKKEESVDRQIKLAEALGSFSDHVQPGYVEQAAQQLIGKMRLERPNDVETVDHIVAAMVNLGKQVPEELADQCVQKLLHALNKREFYFQHIELARDSAFLSVRTSSSQSTASIKQIIEVIKQATNPRRITYHARDLALFGKHVSAEQVAEVATILLEGLNKNYHAAYAGEMSLAFGYFGTWLPLERISETASILIEAFGKSEDIGKENAILRSLSSLLLDTDSHEWKETFKRPTASAKGKKLSSSQAVAGVRHIVAKVNATSDIPRLRGLTSAARLFAMAVDPAESQKAIHQLVAALRDTNDHIRRYYLLESLAHFSSHISNTTMNLIGDEVVSIMKSVDDDAIRINYFRALSKFGQLIEQRYVAVVAERIVPMLKQATHLFELGILTTSLKQFGQKIPPTIAGEVAKYLLSESRVEKDEKRFQILGEALGNTSVAVTVADANEMTGHLLALIKKSNDANRQSVLAGALSKFCKRASPKVSQAVSKSVVAELKKQTDDKQLDVFGDLLVRLGDKLHPNDVKVAFDFLYEIANRSKVEPEEQYAVFEVLQGLEKRLSPESANQLAAKLIAELSKPNANVLHTFCCSRLLGALSQVSPETVDNPKVVELLKCPFAIDEIRASLLTYAARGHRNKAGSQFPTLDSFVNWTIENQLKVDLARPPTHR